MIRNVFLCSEAQPNVYLWMSACVSSLKTNAPTMHFSARFHSWSDRDKRRSESANRFCGYGLYFVFYFHKGFLFTGSVDLMSLIRVRFYKLIGERDPLCHFYLFPGEQKYDPSDSKDRPSSAVVSR